MNLEELIFPTLEVFHILGIVLLVGTTAMVDFAVLGFGLKSPGPAEIAQQLRVWSWTGLGLILLSGPMMFLTDPDMYYLNHAFQAKMVLLLAALGVQHSVHRKAVAAGGRKGISVLSLSLWASVAFGGIFIGFA